MRPPRYHILSVENGTLPLGGWDLSSSPDVLRRLGRSTLARNVILNHRGKIEMRGGIPGYLALPNIALQTQFWPSPVDPTKLLFARNDVTFQRVTMPSPFGGGVATGATFAAPVGVTQPRLGWSTTLGAYTYGMSQNTGGFAFTRWDGTEAAANLVKYANAPAAQTVGVSPSYSFEGCGTTHLQRVIVGGCTPPGAVASTSDSATLTWSITGGPTADALSSWQDPVSGLTNKIVLDDISDKIVNVISWNGRLYILRERSIWVLAGTAPANWSVRKVADMGASSKYFDPSITLGGTAAQRVIALRDALYFVNNKGLFKFDGARTDKVTAGLDALADIYPNQLLNKVVLVPLSPTDLYLNTPVLSAIYNVETGTWVELTLPPANVNIGFVQAAGRVGDTTWIADNVGIIPLDTILSGAANTQGCDVVDVAGPNRASIDVSVRSALFELGTPARAAMVTRLRLDYYLAAKSGRTPPSLSIFLLDDANSILWQHIEPGNAWNADVRFRKVYDVMVEAAGGVSLKLDLLWSGSNTTLSSVSHYELLNAEIEFAHSEDRTG